MSRRRRVRFRAREQVRFGPYFRTYAGTVDAGGARARFTSHGLRFRTPLGRLTINLTRRTWSWDTPGPGSLSGSWGGDRQ